MDDISISELKPELPELASKQIRGVVTLIWPYSSSARQFAFLLSHTDFRLRRKNGQVRVRFSGSSARAIASTGVGIGDEVVLSLRGAEFARDSSVNTPGKCIDWELAYTQTLSSQITREGKELADLDLVDVAPTPAPRSPVRPRLSVESSPQWSSPAFLKRTRLSDVSILEPAYDPLTDDVEDGHAKKRRRRSYRDWNTWTYLARTPSPDKEDVGMDGLASTNGSPIRATQLPDTPVSPAKVPVYLDVESSQELDQENTSDEGQTLAEVHQVVLEDSPSGKDRPETDATKDDFVRDAVYYDLCAGLNEQSPDHDRVISRGDSGPNINGEDVGNELQVTVHLDNISAGSTQGLAEAHSGRQSSEDIEVSPKSDDSEAGADDTIGFTETGGFTEAEANDVNDTATKEVVDRRARERSETHDDPIVLDDASDNAPEAVMPPPPTLSLLQTDFHTSYKPGMLTPIGKEPSSPNLQPLDSSTLPMPSPFPGERDGNVTSYLDFVSSSQQPSQQVIVEETKQELPEDEADYIMETSFYSSVSSSRAPAFHPTHESAFTDVRFTFGMDGSAFSRPQTSSGQGKPRDPMPHLEDTTDSIEDSHSSRDRLRSPIAADKGTIDTTDAPETYEGAVPDNAGSPVEPPTSQQITVDEMVALSASSVVREVQPDIEMGDGNHRNGYDAAQNELDEDQKISHGAILGPEPSDVRGHDHEADHIAGHLDRTTGNESFEVVQDNVTPGLAPQHSTVSEVIDIGSPSEENDEDFESFESVQAAETPIQRIPEKEHVQKLHPTKVAITQILPAQHDLLQHDRPAGLEQFVRPETTRNLEINEEVAMVAETLDSSTQDTASMQQDVKMESVEEAFSSFIDEAGGHGKDEALLDTNSELLIAVPEEGNKVGELHLVSVPDTAPAKNTRFKAKTSMSHEKEVSVSSQNTRSHKRGSLAPLSQFSQGITTPPATRSRSTVSPTKESLSTSPYSLRSQSKRLSTTKPTIPAPKKTNRHQRSTWTRSSAEPSPQGGSFIQDSLHMDDFDFPWTNFGPSQELGTLPNSQGKFANAPYVKDSEESSMHSEGSLSTVQSTPSKARVTSHGPTSPVMLMQTAGPEVAVADNSTEAKSLSSFATQLPLSSPTRSIRSVASASVASSTPRRSRRINKGLSGLPADAGMVDVHAPEAARPADDEVAYPTLSAPGEDVEMRSPPVAHRPVDENITAVESDEQTVKAPGAEKTETASANQSSVLPMTPDASQRTLVDLQPSFTAVQDQTLPLTPQLTQSTSAALRSFKEASSHGSQEATIEIVAKPSLVTKTTPRRNATTTDVASPSASPKPSVHSASDGQFEAVEVETPSIGLSTPTAYYTPLKDLPYFLNRSSTFHSAGSPDVLALVTTASTPPTRTTKGPKHHTTTLHITDLSIYPSQTTVQVFRAYADALPVAESGDVVLLRAFSVRSLNRHPCLVSADESAWCVWRYSKPLWGKKRGAFGDVKSREEVKGPAVERGEGEWAEVEKLRAWYTGTVKGELEDKARRTRSKDKEEGASRA